MLLILHLLQHRTVIMRRFLPPEELEDVSSFKTKASNSLCGRGGGPSPFGHMVNTSAAIVEHAGFNQLNVGAKLCQSPW